MAIQNIAIGTPGAGGGDPAHAAFTKINQNFSNPQHAASRMVGVSAGNLMEVGVSGFGSTTSISYNSSWGENPNIAPSAFVNFIGSNGIILKGATTDKFSQIWITTGGSTPKASFYTSLGNNSSSGEIFFKTTANTMIDGNGFIKAASPIVKIFADKIELNDEAQQQNIEFEKLGAGDYLIKGSSGFAQEGWYIEMPKDANGNVLVAVVYEQLENNDISVKTYAKKFDDETGDIVANLTKPRDIPSGRCIDLRLQELPQPEIQIPESIAPPNFQPTGLAEAVATVMESYHDPEQ